MNELGKIGTKSSQLFTLNLVTTFKMNNSKFCTDTNLKKTIHFISFTVVKNF